jgi:hypothetical protein
MLVLEPHPEEGAGGKLWWYSEDFQIPVFDVLTTSGQTHCFRENSKSVQARVFCSLDNMKLDRVILTEHGTWMSSIQKTSRLATRLQRERQAIGAVASGIGDQGLDQGKERGGQAYEQHLLPTLGIYMRQESGHRLPSRREHKSQVEKGMWTEPEDSPNHTKTIVATIELGGPADKAGVNLRVDDEIIQVDSRSTERMEWPSVAALMAGEPGEVVCLQIRRAAGDSQGDIKEIRILRQSEFDRLRRATVRASSWAAGEEGDGGEEKEDGRGGGGARQEGGTRVKRMAKWQRAGSLYTEGAELLDETSSSNDRGSANESDRAKYNRWREQAKDAKKEVYQESPWAHGRCDASVATGQAAAYAGNADLGKMWNPMSERKAKLAARLLRVETRAQTYRRLLRQALEEVRALEDAKASLALSCNTVCSEMGALRGEHEHLQKTHASALQALDIAARDAVLLRHKNAALRNTADYS